MEEILIGLINISLLFYIIKTSHLMPKKSSLNPRTQTSDINISEIREAILR